MANELDEERQPASIVAKGKGDRVLNLAPVRAFHEIGLDPFDVGVIDNHIAHSRRVVVNESSNAPA